MAVVTLDFQPSTTLARGKDLPPDSIFWWLFESRFVTQGGLPVTGGFIVTLWIVPWPGQTSPPGFSACKCQVVKQISHTVPLPFVAINRPGLAQEAGVQSDLCSS